MTLFAEALIVMRIWVSVPLVARPSVHCCPAPAAFRQTDQTCLESFGLLRFGQQRPHEYTLSATIPTTAQSIDCSHITVIKGLLSITALLRSLLTNVLPDEQPAIHLPSHAAV